MDHEQKNCDGGSGKYQWKKWGDKNNQKGPKYAKASGIPSGVYYTGIDYTNVTYH